MPTRLTRNLGPPLAISIGFTAGSSISPVEAAAEWASPHTQLALVSEPEPGHPTLTTVGGTTPTRYYVYHNGRFGFSINYPSTFRLSELPTNGDGIGFIPPDGAGDFRAYAGLNGFDQRGEQLFQDTSNDIIRSGGTVTYTTLTASGFIVSGVVGSTVRYERVILSDAHGRPVSPTAPSAAVAVINSFRAEYPTSRKQEYDPIVSAMSRSLRPGMGTDPPS
jgi:hypothetical protein